MLSRLWKFQWQQRDSNKAPLQLATAARLFPPPPQSHGFCLVSLLIPILTYQEGMVYLETLPLSKQNMTACKHAHKNPHASEESLLPPSSS